MTSLPLPKPAAAVVEALAKKRILGGVPVHRLHPQKEAENLLLVAATELNTEWVVLENDGDLGALRAKVAAAWRTLPPA